MPLRLITVGFSHYCEKARWALDWGALPYTEERHLPMLHWAATFAAGGGRTVPVLVTDAGVLADSTDILDYVDRHATPATRLYPDEPEMRAECAALEDRFDERLGPATRRFGYYYAFADRGLILELAKRGTPRWQFAMMRAALPLVRSVMLRTMRIDARTVDDSLREIRTIFDDVGTRLRDGRRYLMGDRFSAADLAFAALAAPMVLPPEHPFPMPAERFPPPVHELWRAMRRHSAGAFVLRLYAEHRARPAP